MSLLFDQPLRFQGLPESGFGVFSIEDRDARREAILEAFHPALRDLGDDLIEDLTPADEAGEHPEARLHAHLPRLDWPRGYQPFATWLALSRDAHGYQSGPQLNVGVHADHVAIRLGWDTSSDYFGRFEFLARRANLGERLIGLATEHELCFRVYAAARWPAGSRCVFESTDSLDASFDEVHRRGVWWELGRRYDLPACTSLICSPELGAEAIRLFRLLLPVYDRIVGDPHHAE